jgi:hypothetical protein
MISNLRKQLSESNKEHAEKAKRTLRAVTILRTYLHSDSAKMSKETVRVIIAILEGRDD